MSTSLPILDLYRATGTPSACSYLPVETSTFEYRLPASLSSAQWQELLRRGWRRHGINFFRPACPNCRKCRSLRVDVDRFQPTKSQRRTGKRNADVEVALCRPSLSEEQIDLYNAYHADMHERRGWPLRQTDFEEYADGFLRGNWPFAYELQYRRKGKLIGLGLVDAIPEGLSSIYFYHDPEWRPLGPGTFTVLQEIEAVRRLGGRYLYLGYWIAECQSMAYKSRFGPHQILERYVADDEEPDWRDAISAEGGDEIV